MDEETARRILRVSVEDDADSIKRKYRRMIKQFHPDSAYRGRDQSHAKAQEIIDAYRVLKTVLRDGDSCPYAAGRRGRPWNASYGHMYRHDGESDHVQREDPAWDGIENAAAFCERDVYRHYVLSPRDENGKPLYYRAAHGRYFWDPEEEELGLFLLSIRRASAQLLDDEEKKALMEGRITYEGSADKARRSHFQRLLFECLLDQFVQPLDALRSIVSMESLDGEGREIFCIPAYLMEKGAGRRFNILSGLHEGDTLFPGPVRENKITVIDRQRRDMGSLSFGNDSLYLCVIPLLREHLAQVNIRVRKVIIDRNRRPFSLRVLIDFRLRLPENADDHVWNDRNDEIRRILRNYAR